MQICLYFINLVVEDYQTWSFMQEPEMQQRRQMHPHRFPNTRTMPALTLMMVSHHAYIIEKVHVLCLPDRMLSVMTISLSSMLGYMSEADFSHALIV